MPKYEERFDLISATGTPEGVNYIVRFYCCIGGAAGLQSAISRILPNLTLETQKLGKRVLTQVASTATTELSFLAIDTTPTYNNEEEVSLGMAKDTFCIAKVPKHATTPKQVRQELQVTLDKIKRKKVDFLLLHWPCDVIIAGLLKEVWFAIEKCIPDRLASTLDVCNFNITALRMLLPHCEKLRLLVNQQWDLINFCA